MNRQRKWSGATGVGRRWREAGGPTLFLFAFISCYQSPEGSRSYVIEEPRQIIGGPAALATVGDVVLENNRIRLAISKKGNSVGPGIFGGSLIDADLYRPQAAYRGGLGLDQFAELWPVGNLAVPAVCVPNGDKVPEFCGASAKAIIPSVRVLCDGRTPCLACYGAQDCLNRGGVIDLALLENADYADPDDPSRPGAKAPSVEAAVVRVEGQSGNFMEALALVSLTNAKMNFRFRNDYILEPDQGYMRIRTLLSETNSLGELSHPEGQVTALPAITQKMALFSILLGSQLFPTVLPGMEPGVAGGDFLYFGDRLNLFAPAIGFDVYREIRRKFALGQDPLNDSIEAEFIAGVGKNVSYAIASAEPGGKVTLPIVSGAVTIGFTNATHCYSGVCTGNAEQCAQVTDCSKVRSFVFERIFSVGHGDVASAASPLYQAWGIPMGQVRGHVVRQRGSQGLTNAQVLVYPIPKNQAECRQGGDPNQPYQGGAQGFYSQCLAPRRFSGSVSHFRTDPGAEDMPEGAFLGSLPVGSYYLLAKKAFYPVSEVAQITVEAGRPADVVLALGPQAKVRFEVRDESNRLIPAKLTLGQCFPNCSGRMEEPCGADADCSSGKCEPAEDGSMRCLVDDCPADRACEPKSHRCQKRGLCNADSDCDPIERCLHDPVANQGRCVCERTTQREAALMESNDPSGLARTLYTATGQGEFEIEPGRYEVWVSRGIEYSVDRQQLILSPGGAAVLSARLVREIDTSGWISGDFHMHSQNSFDGTVSFRDRVISFAGEGVELVSTSDHDYLTRLDPYLLELGLQGWLRTQVGEEVSTVETGHFLGFPLRYQEWQDGAPVGQRGAIDWTGKRPEQLFDEIRGLGSLGPDQTVVVAAHPNDSFFGYFYQFGLNTFNPNKVEPSALEMYNPIIIPENFSGRFDALEVLNDRRFELIRTPSVGEMRRYNFAQASIQALGNSGADPDWIEAQLMDLERATVREFFLRTPAEQEAIWNSTGTQKCDLIPFCSSDAQCNTGIGERCDLEGQICYLPCSTSQSCQGRPCIEGHCQPNQVATDAPCILQDGVLDSWFRLMDYNVIRTGLANSDSHHLFSGEAGSPRNYVQASADRPLGIDSTEVAKNIKAGRVMGTYGPFVEVWLGDARIGDTWTVPQGQPTVPLRIKVQAASWFDVDRIEVYRSGKLIHVFTGAGDELDPASPVNVSGLRLPNHRPVRFDAVIDEPIPPTDSWFVVVAMGINGRDLSPVYAEVPYRSVEIGEVIGRALAVTHLPLGLSGVSIPRVFRIHPYAFTNPIFLDVDGNGRYDASRLAPAWASGSRVVSQSNQALASSPSSGTEADLVRTAQTRFWKALFRRR